MKKSSSIIINLIFLSIYIINILFNRFLIFKYTKVFIFHRYYNYQILLNEIFNNYKKLIQFLLKTIKIDEEQIRKNWCICIGYSIGNGYNIIELNNDLSEIVYICILVELINQRRKLEKSFVIIYLVYMIEEDEKKTKKKKQNKKRIYMVESI